MNTVKMNFASSLRPSGSKALEDKNNNIIDWNFSVFSWNLTEHKAIIYSDGNYITTSLSGNGIDFRKVKFGGYKFDDDAQFRDANYHGYIYDVQIYDEFIPKEGLDALMANPGATYPLPEGALFKYE
jgi:hypothetical protein